MKDFTIANYASLVLDEKMTDEKIAKYLKVPLKDLMKWKRARGITSNTVSPGYPKRRRSETLEEYRQRQLQWKELYGRKAVDHVIVRSKEKTTFI